MRWLWALLLCIALPAGAYAQQQVIVLANVEDDGLQLSRNEVRNLFMGNLARSGLQPVALEPNHPVRIVFNTRVVGLTESRVQSYWAQMRFTGRTRQPREFPGIAEMLSYIQETPGAVGYFPEDYPLPPGLRLIYRSR